MSLKKRWMRVLAIGLGAVAVLMSGSAQAASVLHFRIFEPSAGVPTEFTDAIVDITLTVDDPGDPGGQGSFLFENEAESYVKVLSIFMEEGLDGIIDPIIENVAFDAANSSIGVSFSPVSPNMTAPPGGNNLLPVWDNDATFFEAKKDGSASLDGDEHAAFTFDFVAGKTLADIDAVISDNNFDHNGRVAIHVGGFTGNPDSFSAITVDVPPSPIPVIPLPGTVWMGVALLAVMGGAALRGRAKRR